MWLEDKTQTSKAGSRKLANIWTGPFLILEVLSNRLVILLTPTTTCPRLTSRVSVDRLRPYLVPVHQPWMTGQTQFRFPLFILAKKLVNGKTMYKVQWLSKDPVPDSWEPSDNLPLALTFMYEHRLRTQHSPVAPPLPLFPSLTDSDA
jgi:hypothetical protein